MPPRTGQEAYHRLVDGQNIKDAGGQMIVFDTREGKKRFDVSHLPPQKWGHLRRLGRVHRVQVTRGNQVRLLRINAWEATARENTSVRDGAFSSLPCLCPSPLACGFALCAPACASLVRRPLRSSSCLRRRFLGCSRSVCRRVVPPPHCPRSVRYGTFEALGKAKTPLLTNLVVGPFLG